MNSLVNIFTPYSRVNSVNKRAMNSLRAVFVVSAILLVIPNNIAVAYSPSASVTAAHNIPHLSIYLKALSNTFSITTSTINTSNTYLLSVLILPGIFLALGILSLFVLALIMFSRCCCKCSRNAPDVKVTNGKNDEEYAKWAKCVIDTKITLIVFFSFFLITAFSGAQIAWYGSSRYNSGINTLMLNVGILGQLFQALNYYGISFSTLGTQLNTQLTSSTCASTHPSAISTISGYVTIFSNAGATIASDTSSLYTTLNSANTYLSTYAVHDKNTAFYVGYSVVSGFCLLIALGAGLRSKVLSQVMFFFTYWLVFLLSIVSSLVMIMVVSPLSNSHASSLTYGQSFVHISTQ